MVGQKSSLGDSKIVVTEEKKQTENENFIEMRKKEKKTLATTKVNGLRGSWSDVLKRYKVIKKIGEGSFGQVHEAECLATKRKVAIKHMTDFADRDYGLVKVIRELQLMRLLGEECCSFMPELLDVIIPYNER